MSTAPTVTANVADHGHPPLLESQQQTTSTPPQHMNEIAHHPTIVVNQAPLSLRESPQQALATRSLDLNLNDQLHHLPTDTVAHECLNGRSFWETVLDYVIEKESIERCSQGEPYTHDQDLPTSEHVAGGQARANENDGGLDDPEVFPHNSSYSLPGLLVQGGNLGGEPLPRSEVMASQ